MLKNYLKIALRNIKKFKIYSIINISGLAIGMACTILILLWVQDELSFDRFHENANRLFRVTDYEKYSNGEEIWFTQNPAPLAPILKEENVEILEAVRCRKLGNTVVQHKNRFFNEDGLVLVDPAFLTIFTYPFILGSKENALVDPYSVVITESMASKYFGEEDPIGKVIKLDDRIDFQVTGVIRNVPANSHLQFDILLPFQTAKDFYYRLDSWNSCAHTIYVLLDENANYRLVGDKIKNTIKRYNKEAIVTLSLQRLVDIHLRSGTMWGIGGKGDIKFIYIFSIIAGFVLFIACINFMNLSTARASNRAKEVGLRKVVGANRKAIIYQFYGESLIFAFIALLFSLILVQIFIPFFNSISGKALHFDIFANLNIMLLLLSIIFITGIISGSYPALYLSSFKPVKVLKGSLKSGLKNSTFRRTLVSIQFILTIILIIGTIVVNRQLHFLKNHKLGYNKEHIICIKLQGELNRKLDNITAELKTNEDVINVSAVSDTPTNFHLSTILHEWEGRNPDEQFLIHILFADYDLINTLDLEMVDGRYFSREFIADTADGYVVNEAAVRTLGMDSPVGKSIANGRILGVVKDFNFNSLHEKISPLMIYYIPENVDNIMVRVQSNDITRTIRNLESSWHTIFPGYPFEYSFLDEKIDELYRVEQRIENVMNAFTFLALFIACLGLFGLASFTAEQRTKEIGIRKVLGASVNGIVVLLSKEFTKYVLVANLIAWPISWFAMNKWLQNYAYRIHMEAWIFVSAGLLALIVALFTVSYQAVRAAQTNPVDALHYE